VLDETKTITGVIDETKTAMKVTTRVIEEREWKDDELIEVSSLSFARRPRMSSTLAKRSMTTKTEK